VARLAAVLEHLLTPVRHFAAAGVAILKKQKLKKLKN
jgi:hypothetical protein